MKLGPVMLIVLVCTQLHAGTATTTDPTLAVQKVAASKPTPQPSPVNVMNFPDVQGVSGTVDVGNLPVDATGALRVACQCPNTPPVTAQYIDSLPGGPAMLQPGA